MLAALRHSLLTCTRLHTEDASCITLQWYSISHSVSLQAQHLIQYVSNSHPFTVGIRFPLTLTHSLATQYWIEAQPYQPLHGYCLLPPSPERDELKDSAIHTSTEPAPLSDCGQGFKPGHTQLHHIH